VNYIRVEYSTGRGGKQDYRINTESQDSTKTPHYIFLSEMTGTVGGVLHISADYFLSTVMPVFPSICSSSFDIFPT
jgi:hypothetical protein